MNTDARDLFVAIARHNAAVLMAAASSSPPGPQEKRARRRTSYVLVVDDDPDILDVIHQELADCGYRVRTATDGESAVDVLKQEYFGDPPTNPSPAVKPSVILLDLHMRGKSGQWFLEHLRGHMPQFADVEVVPMSDSASINEFTTWAIQKEGLSVPRESLPKPLTRELLIERVAQWAGLPPDKDEPDDDR